MDKKSCPEGKKWDHLVHTCVSSKSLMGPNTDPPKGLPLTAVNQLEAINTTAKPNSLVVLSPTLWIFVVLVVVGSILALTVWFIIWKRQTRRSSTCENGILGVKLLQNAAPPAKLHPLPPEKNGQAEIFQSVAEAPSLCFHVTPGSQTGSKWEDDFTATRDLPMSAGAEAGGGSPACSTMAEHRIPLPATELGGTALVTTKTM
ncbi:uncharacterized protein LOC115784546 [Archocentrus centrarchus]|uniref:uncharacterized protein LOC115784546 n=1 Tax=Archocentrus centrarchus TaxID=63155 RepID=UPI0011EA45F4|nr:uncharacterized protein LOC115784546 [Archocentrus centrarchus]